MGIAAAVIVAVLCVVHFRGPRAGVDVGFEFEEFPFTFSAAVTAALGGPLTSSEIAAPIPLPPDEPAEGLLRGDAFFRRALPSGCRRPRERGR